MTEPRLTDVPGVGEATAKALAAVGIGNAGDLARASTATLTAVRGLGPSRAASIRTAARSLLETDSDGSHPGLDTVPSKKKKRDKKKDKKKDKRKRKKKRKDKRKKKDKKGGKGKKDKKRGKGKKKRKKNKK